MLARLPLPVYLPALFWQSPRPAPGTFELVAADIGQGNGSARHSQPTRCRTPACAIRLTATPERARVLVPWLVTCGRAARSSLVISHRDMIMPAARRPLTASPGSACWPCSFGHARSMAPGDACEADSAGSGMRCFEVLHPPAVPGALALAQHRLLRAAGVGWRGRAALLTGDIERPGVGAGRKRRGCSTPTCRWCRITAVAVRPSEAFQHAVRPRQARIQAGHRNRYGHPAPDVVERYQRAAFDHGDFSRPAVRRVGRRRRPMRSAAIGVGAGATGTHADIGRGLRRHRQQTEAG